MMKLKISNLSPQLRLLLLVYLCIPGYKSEVPVVTALSVMTPIINTSYYMQCKLTMVPDESDEIYTYPLQFKGTGLFCSVSNWRYCDIRQLEHKHEDCGCNSKNSSSSTVDYHFFLFVDPVSEKYRGTQLTCEVGKASDTRPIDVVDFTGKPDETMYVCKNKTLVLDWEFNPFRDVVQIRFQPITISWTSYKEDGSSWSHLATYSISEDGKEIFNHDGSRRKSTVSKENSVLPQLILQNLQTEDSEKIIKINVTFNSSKILGRVTRDSNEVEKRPLPVDVTHLKHLENTGQNKTSLTLLSPLARSGREESNETDYLAENAKENDEDIELEEDQEANYDTFGEIGKSKAETTTEKKTPPSTTTTTTATTTMTPKSTASKIPQTTTPSPVNYQLKEPSNNLLGSVKLIVTEPPLGEIIISISGTLSLTGNLVISCHLLHMISPGKPPVNLTIWHDKKLLITRSGVDILHYSTEMGGDVIRCGLEGPALNCLDENDPRKKEDIKNIKDLQKEEKPETSPDILLTLYAWESLTCLCIMLWALSLFLDHILYIVRKRKHEIITQNRIAFEAERKRIRELSLKDDMFIPLPEDYLPE